MNLPLAYLHPLASSVSPVRLLTASPSANGWHDAKGIAVHVPSVYSALTLATLTALSSSPSPPHILEWIHPSHSFHAKGLWLTGPHSPSPPTPTTTRSPFPPTPPTPLPPPPPPTLTIVGSTNFGERSLERDGEVSLVVVTKRGGVLAEELRKERDRLFDGGVEVTRDTFEAEGSPRRLSWLVKWVARFAKGYL